MKKVFLFLFLFGVIYKGICQPTFLGITSYGGDGFGTIFKTDGDGNNQSVVSTFSPNTIGANPSYLKLCEAPNGKMYGMTEGGGSYNLGVIFEYDYTTNVYTKKLDLDSTTGCRPRGSLILGSNGKLYGMTTMGGAFENGVIFEYDYITDNYIKKLDLNSIDGYYPYGALLEASNGKFYGLTFYGGASNKGTLFEYDCVSNVYAKKIDLTVATGNQPRGSLIQASNGKLYGTTYRGGTNNSGVIFEYDISINVFTNKLNFISALGTSPCGDLLEASTGKLYGFTSSSGGTGSNGVIFEYNYITSTYTKKFSFTGSNGNSPYGAFTKASNGKLYALTGGNVTGGVLLEYDHINSVFTKKFSFNTIFPNIPQNGTYSTMVQAGNGKLYGSTMYGGSSNLGIIFEYDFLQDSLTSKVEFNGLNGLRPFGSMMQANNGKFYGTTLFGGLNNDGVLYEYEYSTNSYTKKANFNAAVGVVRNPLGKLVQAPNGNLYGIASGPSSIIYEYNITTNTITKKLDINILPNSYNAVTWGSLTVASNGKIYGLTSKAGNCGGGVFEYDYINNIVTPKFINQLCGVTWYFNESLLEVPGGKLYGTTRNGISTSGTIFEYDYNTNVYTTKITSGMGGVIGPLLLASNGKIYGAGENIAAPTSGLIFEYDYLANIYTNKYFFSNSPGTKPNGSIMQASNGKIYGMTWNGGGNNLGALYEYDYNSNICVSKLNFNGVNGSTPMDECNLIEICATTPVSPLSVSGNTIVCETASVLYNVAPVVGATFYSWSLPNGWSGTSTTNSITVNAGGASGSLSVTANNACVNSSATTLSVSVNQAPIITANSGTICSGNSFTIVPGGADIYSYSGGTNVVTPSSTTSYTVIGTYTLSSCSNTVVNSVIVNPTPTITVNSGAVCAGNSFTISPAGASTYSYSNGANIVVPSSNDSYSVTGTDINGCISNEVVSSVTVNALPIVTVNNGIICSGNSFTMTPSGANTYSFSSGNDVVSPTNDATYTVTGTNANGCENTATSSVTVNVLPNVLATTNNTLLCVGQTATLAATGAISYSWSTTETTTDIVVSPTVTTIYTLDGIDANGCSNTYTISQDVDLCTGIVSFSKSEILLSAIYPNPTNGSFTIELNTESQIIVTNTLGQIALTESLTVGKHNLDILNQPSGIYFVKVISGKEQQTFKLIKE